MNKISIAQAVFAELVYLRYIEGTRNIEKLRFGQFFCNMFAWKDSELFYMGSQLSARAYIWEKYVNTDVKDDF